MLDRFLPPRIDNTYRGYTIALWLFGLLLFMRGVIGVRSMFDGYTVATKADGLPLATYGAAASSTIVGLFGLLGLSHFVLCLIGIVVLIRYRSAVSAMFAVFLLQHLGARLLGRLHPIAATANPPGTYVTLTLLAIMIAGLLLSLPTRPPAHETSQSATVR